MQARACQKVKLNISNKAPTNEIAVPCTYFCMLNFQQPSGHSHKRQILQIKIYTTVSRIPDFEDILNIQTALPITTALIEF